MLLMTIYRYDGNTNYLYSFVLNKGYQKDMRE